MIVVPCIKQVWSTGTGNILQNTMVKEKYIAVAGRGNKAACKRYAVSPCS